MATAQARINKKKATGKTRKHAASPKSGTRKVATGKTRAAKNTGKSKVSPGATPRPPRRPPRQRDRKAPPKSVPKGSTAAGGGLKRELIGVLTLALGLTLGLAVWSFTTADDLLLAAARHPVSNLIGSVGHHVAGFLLGLFGIGAFVMALVLTSAGLLSFTKRKLRLATLEFLEWSLVVVSGTVLAHLLLPKGQLFFHPPGGVIGLAGGEMLRGALGTVGASIAAGTLFLLATILAADLRVHRVTLGLLGAGEFIVGGLHRWSQRAFARHALRRAQTAEARSLQSRVRAARRTERRETRAVAKSIAAAACAERAASAPPTQQADASVLPVAREDVPLTEVAPPPLPEPLAALDLLEERPASERPDPLNHPNHSDPIWTMDLGQARPTPAAPPKFELPESGPQIEGLNLTPTQGKLEPPLEGEPAAAMVPPRAEPHRALTPDLPVQTQEQAKGPAAPTIVEAKQSEASTHAPKQEPFAFTTHGGKFVLPSLDLLDPIPEHPKGDVDRSELHETAHKLTTKLADFGISGEVTKIRLGPVVTMYEFVPGPGIKISKIASLSDDLAMAMEALRVRIVAPLPGKGAVGIEVPNKVRQSICLREILEQEIFKKTKSPLTLGIGKDVEGMPFVMALDKMPHLLIAGTTGSGKSVSVNAMISSILYRSTPDQVRFIMIDPKWTELSLYEGIPHLLLPVVKDPAQASLALRWAVEEMDRRYQLLADFRVRSLAGFNTEADKRLQAWEARQAALPPLPSQASINALLPDDPARLEFENELKDRLAADPRPPARLPLIVIIIDELADLMMVSGREVETYIARIAQKARAAGLHLLVATQRPSTDVLTGLIKVNFPARIGFRVASRHDSQTIINQPGSEKLLGMGDMLVIPPGQSDPARAHGAFVSDDEIKRVVEHLKTQGKPIYDESILRPRQDEDEHEGGDADSERDSKWDEAVFVVSERETVSVSMLQRKMKIGYNRAARIIDQMERENIVGPADGAKPREVMVSAH